LILKEIKRPEIIAEVFEINNKMAKKVWDTFKHHHYMSAYLLFNNRYFLITWKHSIVGFCAVSPFPLSQSKIKVDSVRIHRLVILPDFQGLGFGKQFLEFLSNMYVNVDHRYTEGRMYIRTSNMKFGEYMKKSSNWESTGLNEKNHEVTLNKKNKNKKNSSGFFSSDKINEHNVTKIAYSYKYIGNTDDKFEYLYKKYKENKLELF